MAKPKAWRWTPAGPGTWVLRDGRGRNRANVWANGVWHSWDTDGIGGENGVCDGPNRINDARDQAMAAVVRQGWTPWEVIYEKA